MDKITTIKTPKKGAIDHYFIASDWHSDHLDYPTYEILLKHAKLFPKKDRKLIINGDFLDVPHLMKRDPNFSAYAKSAHGIEDYFLPISEDEFAWGNEILDELQKVFSEVIYISGNHDWRYDWFISTKHCPAAYKHNFDLRRQLKLKDRGIPFIQYNDWLDIGKLSITHGMYHSSTSHKKHFEACGRSCIFGHIHKFEAKSFVSRGDTKTAWSLPALCGLSPEYTRNSDNNWTNGYATFHVKHNGKFNMHVHTIWDGELILPDGRLL